MVALTTVPCINSTLKLPLVDTLDHARARMTCPTDVCGSVTLDKPTVKLLVSPPEKILETQLLSTPDPGSSLRSASVYQSGQLAGFGLHEPGFSMSLSGRR